MPRTQRAVSSHQDPRASFTKSRFERKVSIPVHHKNVNIKNTTMHYDVSLLNLRNLIKMGRSDLRFTGRSRLAMFLSHRIHTGCGHTGRSNPRINSPNRRKLQNGGVILRALAPTLATDPARCVSDADARRACSLAPAVRTQLVDGTGAPRADAHGRGPRPSRGRHVAWASGGDPFCQQPMGTHPTVWTWSCPHRALCGPSPPRLVLTRVRNPARRGWMGWARWGLIRCLHLTGGDGAP